MSSTTRNSLLSGPGLGRRAALAELDRALRVGRRELHRPDVVADDQVDVEPPSEALVEALRPIDIGDGQRHDLERHVDRAQLRRLRRGGTAYVGAHADLRRSVGIGAQRRASTAPSRPWIPGRSPDQGLHGRDRALAGRAWRHALRHRPRRTFPDYELPDHDDVPRKLSELQGDDPLILTLARGHYCPKEHQQHLELAAHYPKIAVAYTQIATIATDDHHTLQEFRASVGAQWPFLSDPERIVQKDLDIQEYTDPDNDPMIPHTLVLKPGLVVHSIYNGYWFWGRPSVADLWHDLREVTREIRPDWDLEHARAARGLGRGRPLALPWLGQVGRDRAPVD